MLRTEESKKANITILIVSAALICASAVLLLCARLLDGFAEWYACSVYALLVSSVGRLSGSLPFSLAEVLVLILPLIIIAGVIRNRKHIGVFFRRLLIFLSVLIFLYSANCGANYYRDPFVSPEIYNVSSFTSGQLADFCEYIAGQLRQSSAQTEVAAFDYPDRNHMAEAAVNAMKDLGKEYDSLSGYYPVPKSLSVLSGAFSSMGVSGIYSPFTIEANTNSEMPGMEKPFTACHELSHLKGYMNEGEANYIGWLACIGSDEPAFRRSGWLIAWTYAGSALFREDPDRYMAILETLPEDAVLELRQNHDFWTSHETKASDIQDRVNDVYLRSNGQEEGIDSYGRLTSLMLAWYLSSEHL